MHFGGIPRAEFRVNTRRYNQSEIRDSYLFPLIRFWIIDAQVHERSPSLLHLTTNRRQILKMGINKQRIPQIAPLSLRQNRCQQNLALQLVQQRGPTERMPSKDGPIRKDPCNYFLQRQSPMFEPLNRS